MSYNTLLSILAPASRIEHARELACCFGEGGLSERGSFASFQWVLNGVQYAPLQCPIRDGLRDYITACSEIRPIIPRPSWDTENALDMTKAQQAMDDAMVILSLPESIIVAPDSIIIALGCDVPALASACGMTRVQD